MCRGMLPVSAQEGFKDKDKEPGEQRQLEVPRKNNDQTGEERRHEDEKKKNGRIKRRSNTAMMSDLSVRDKSDTQETVTTNERGEKVQASHLSAKVASF